MLPLPLKTADPFCPDPQLFFFGCSIIRPIAIRRIRMPGPVPRAAHRRSRGPPRLPGSSRTGGRSIRRHRCATRDSSRARELFEDLHLEHLAVLRVERADDRFQPPDTLFREEEILGYGGFCREVFLLFLVVRGERNLLTAPASCATRSVRAVSTWRSPTHTGCGPLLPA